MCGPCTFPTRKLLSGDSALLSQASALLTEIAIVPPASYKAQQLTDSKGLRCAANFIEKLAEAMPSVAVAHASIFAPHLGGEAYTLRSAIMTMFGHCIHEGFGEHGDERSRAARVKSKQSLLDTLLQRTRDQNAFTRARTLQTWAFLAQRARIPMSHWLVVAQLAAGRLRDKASAVRKAAMQLLQAMLKYNPFGATLVSERYRATLRDAEARLAQEKSLQDEFQDCTGGEGSAGDAGIAASDMASETQNAEGEADAGCGGESSNGAQDVSGGRFSTEAVPSPGDAEEDHEVSPDDLEGGVGTLPSLIAHLKVAVGFIETIMGAIPAVNQLMSTGSVTDINEAINFITDVYEFKVDGSAAALRSVLPLVFSREESVRKSVVDATALIFLSGREAQESAETMLSLVQGATVGDLAALEEVLRLLLQDGGPMDDSIVWALWGLLSGDGELQASQSALAFAQGTSSSVERRRCAVQLLSMVAKHRPSAVAENLRTLLTVCFDSETPADVILVRCSADCIRSAGRHLYDDRSANSGDVLDAIRALTEIIISEDLPMEHWFSAAESAIGAIYAVHPEPEAMARAIITKLTELAAPQGAGIPDNEAGTESAGSGSVCAHEEQQQGFDHAISSYSDHGLAKLFFVVGQVALEQVIHLDWLAGSARRQVAEAAKASYGAQTSRKEKTQGDMSAELGVGTSLATEDAEIDAMKEAGEKELVCPSSLIGSYVPLLKAVCQSKRLSEGHHVLHSSAILSLAKLMVVSEQLCESNQRLLFSLLCTSTTEPSVRSNIVIACGDLFVRFPNAMEPWTSNLYQALSDSDAGVRKNAIMVITHLILNDMMKVKGHVAAVAVCLEDESKQIRELARLFFHELAGKSFKDSNPVFSLLPDILSNLSANPVVPESKFRKIMEHLFAFVSRDKHMDALVEKMCQRLNATAEPAIWRDIAFCLSKLSFTEKGLRILVDSFRLYRHTLQDAEVSGTIKNILANALKGGGSKKEEVRALLTDFETMFSEYTEECQEGPGAADEESSATGSKENDDTPNGSHIDDGDDAAGQSTVIGPQETECKPGAMMPLHDVEDSSKAGQTSGRDPCFGGLEDVACMNPLDGIPVGKAAEDLKSTDRGVLADLKNVVNH
mmetsp:Transcript_17259/g.41204  ORF Transcript_17259/g.41204 Transcript_17259/m.41204 type:complete len:1126 (-) Transcript_17259:192-3569(-)